MSLETFVFDGKMEYVGNVTPLRDVGEIADEPTLFSASWDFAREQGGAVTHEIMDALEAAISLESADPDYPHLTISSRVHLLMPGHLPAIPGWHCDGTPRIEHNGQPDPKRASASLKHYTALVSTVSGLAPTEFLQGPVEIAYDPQHVWASAHNQIESAEPRPPTVLAEEGKVISFDGQTLHRATPAAKQGWRYFFRASFMDEPQQNKIRRQSMVYASDSGGW